MGSKDLKAKIRLEGDASGATRAIKQTESGFKGLVSSVKRNALAIGAALAAVAGAFRGITSAAEKAGQSTAFARGLAAQGVAADEFLAKLREVSDNQIANADLVLATNRALALGIKADALPALLDTAAKASVKLGISVTSAFNDITTGVGRASPLILDNLGIVVDAIKTYDAFAASIGTTTANLTKAQKTMALANAVIRGGASDTFDFADSQNELTRSINVATTALVNMKDAIFSTGAGLLAMATGGATAVFIAISLVQEAVVKTARAFVELARLIPGVDNKLEGLSDTLKRWDDEADTAQRSMAKFSFQMSKAGSNMVLYSLGLKKANVEQALVAPAAEKVARNIREVGEEADTAGDALDDFGDSLDGAKGSASGLRSGMESARSAIQQAGAQAITTARQFDQLADSAGRAAAVSAALQGGGTLSQGGTRIRLPGGGSRLVNTSGRGSSSYSLSEFGTGGIVNVGADGNVRPS